MKLALKDVLSTHQRYAKRTQLEGVLGDGFLYEKNPVFRNIRDVVEACGFSFTTEDFCDYQVGRLNALTKILEQKRIFYIENVPFLARLEQSRPGLFYVHEFEFARNVILHESAHCVAESVFQGHKLLSDRNPSEQILIVRTMLSEAFALATDSMAKVHAEDPEHQFLYSINSYQTSDGMEFRRKLFSDSLQAFGFKATLKSLMYSAIFGQFLRGGLEFDEVKDLVPICLPQVKSMTAENIETFVEVMTTWLMKDVNRTFYRHTSRFYYKGVFGREVDLDQLLGFDFLEIFRKHPEFGDSMDAMIDLAEAGLLSGSFAKIRR